MNTSPPDAGRLSRVIALEGASNARDLGGWPTTGGRHTRFGKIYRSAKLTALTAADTLQIESLGIRSVCDLRCTDEFEREPSSPLKAVQRVSLPIGSDLGRALERVRSEGREVTRDDTHGFIRAAYEAYPETCAEPLRQLFGLMLEGEANLPLLIHCTAGKDRTGFISAVLLTALGVSWDCVLEDYLATNTLWRRDFQVPVGLSEDAAAPLLEVHEALLVSAFAAVDARHGSFDAYLEGALGLDRARLAALRRGLTE